MVGWLIVYLFVCLLIFSLSLKIRFSLRNKSFLRFQFQISRLKTKHAQSPFLTYYKSLVAHNTEKAFHSEKNYANLNEKGEFY
jgi:hypothetical protein